MSAKMPGWSIMSGVCSVYDRPSFLRPFYEVVIVHKGSWVLSRLSFPDIQVFQNPEQVCGELSVKMCSGLICNDDFRSVDQRPGDSYPLLLTA